VAGIQSLLVQAVTHLVQNREQAAGKITRIKPQDEPAITGADPAAAGMDAQVEAASARVEADRHGHGFAQAPLPLDGKGALQCGRMSSAGGDLRRQRN
jgi:hypothetical protein